MNIDVIARTLIDDMRTGGHTLGEDIQHYSNDDLLSLHNALEHWRFQTTRELTRRAGSAQDATMPEPDWHHGCTGCWRTIWH